MIQNFTVRFQLKRNKTRRDGKAPIYLRITLDSKRFENSTHRNTLPENWDNLQQRVKGRNETAKTINNYLSELETDIHRYYNKLLDKDEPITIDDLKRRFRA